MIRMTFRCTDHGNSWTDLFRSKTAAFQGLLNASIVADELEIESCQHVIVELTEVAPDDLTPSERALLAEGNDV